MCGIPGKGNPGIIKSRNFKVVRCLLAHPIYRDSYLVTILRGRSICYVMQVDDICLCLASCKQSSPVGSTGNVLYTGQ